MGWSLFSDGKVGVTWKLFQGVVKPKATMRGKCHIQLSGEDKEKMVKQTLPEDEVEEEEDEPVSTEVDDSDDEESIKEEVAAAIEVQQPEPVKKKVIKKKVVKKAE